ncbi:MAG: hypothetical protein Q7I92_04245 [Humidesulfovibrio sp.]|nr:hypothetical protein [Humidesulfovibrio sp.]
MEKVIAKDEDNRLALSAAKSSLTLDSKPQAEAVVSRRIPKGPFKVLTIPKSWSDSLHATQAKAALRIKGVADRRRPALDETLGKWKQHILSAKITWSRLTEDELLKCGGQVGKLVALVQERYAIVRAEAYRQVKVFIAKLQR